MNYPKRLIKRGSKGKAVRWVQERLTAHGHNVSVDSNFGPKTEGAVRAFQKAHGLDADGVVGPRTWGKLSRPVSVKPQPRPKRSRANLSERAYRVAESLIGVMEQGGNNRGEMVTKIIRANGGTGPEPWCGDFVAYCYRLAGSKSVTRSWAAVRLLRGLLGIKATKKPVRGDLVRFTFSHVGLYSRDLGGGFIETIEGNTGRSGSVSDSRSGGDGVRRKKRSKYLVRDYLHVVR